MKVSRTLKLARTGSGIPMDQDTDGKTPKVIFGFRPDKGPSLMVDPTGMSRSLAEDIGMFILVEKQDETEQVGA
jgi:hypothetical protein